MIQFYGYMKCSTCRNAIKWFEKQGIEVKFIDITEKPPTQALLKKLLASGYELKQLFNTSGMQYRSLKIKDKLAKMSEAEAIKLLASNGMLCKRPIATDGKRHTVGFREAVFEEVWG